MRPLFSDAPVTPAPQSMPAQMPGSQLAAVLSGRGGNFSLPAPSAGVPLSSMMGLRDMLKGDGKPPGSSLIQGPDGRWMMKPEGPSMLDQAGGWLSRQFGGQQGQPNQQTLSWAPGMPQGAAPGLPTFGSPGIPPWMAGQNMFGVGGG